MPKTKNIQETVEESKVPGFFQFKTKIEYSYSTIIIVGYTALVYAAFTFPYISSVKTILLNVFIAILAKFGETGGAHRLWSHRSYKAKLPLRIFLLLCFYINFLFRVVEWVKFHRLHHKYTDTDADPHNTKRGFFYSHVGWLMLEKHPEVIKRIKEQDFSDLYNDPVIKYGEKFYLPLAVALCFIIPAAIPVYYWNESWENALWAALLRYGIGMNLTGTINSFAHFFGSKPYDRNISSSESMVLSILTIGEGWHNYHHVFPWDYKAGELPVYSVNITTFLIDMFSKIGWAYDLKQPSPELIKATILKRGDGTYNFRNEVSAPAS